MVSIIFEGDINEPTCNKSIIGGIRKTTIKDFTKCTDTKPREHKYNEECPKPVELKILNNLN